MAVIAVFNQKGGVGKTTTSLNVAAALVRNRRRVLAIDLDAQSHLTLACGLGPVAARDSIHGFFASDRPLVELVKSTPSGLELIPAHLELSKVEALHGHNRAISGKLRAGLQAGLAWEDRPILVDCCPALGVLTLNAVLAADRVLIPVSADPLSVQGVHRLDAALDALEKRLNRRFERRVVITRFDSRRRLSHQMHEGLARHFGPLLCSTRISECVSLAESPAHGRDVFAHAPASAGARDYRALTEELTERGFFS